jgi:predicted nucleic acid-binding protein
VKYWDASAVIPLLVPEPETKALSALFEADLLVSAWWGTRLECASALARLEREGRLRGRDSGLASTRLAVLSDQWIEVSLTTLVRDAAERMLRVHALRAADALQLAAALVAADLRPATLEFVTLDRRLADAARREGFKLLPA